MEWDLAELTDRMEWDLAKLTFGRFVMAEEEEGPWAAANPCPEPSSAENQPLNVQSQGWRDSPGGCPTPSSGKGGEKVPAIIL